MTSPADIIREALAEIPDVFWPKLDAHEQKLVEDARAALPELEQQLAEATRKYEAMDSRYHDLWHDETDRAEAAEADRDRLQAENQRTRDEWAETENALRAEAQTLRDALNFYAENNFDDGGDIARAALAAPDTPPRYAKSYLTEPDAPDTPPDA